MIGLSIFLEEAEGGEDDEDAAASDAGEDTAIEPLQSLNRGLVEPY